jgi:hypothetical protein
MNTKIYFLKFNYIHETSHPFFQKRKSTLSRFKTFQISMLAEKKKKSLQKRIAYFYAKC